MNWIVIVVSMGAANQANLHECMVFGEIFPGLECSVYGEIWPGWECAIFG